MNNGLDPHKIFVDTIIFLIFIHFIYCCFKQAFVHKAVMDELKRIIEDSEVCLMAKYIFIYKYRLIYVHSLVRLILRFSIVVVFFFFILFYVSLVQCQTFCARVTVNVCEDYLI